MAYNTSVVSLSTAAEHAATFLAAPLAACYRSEEIVNFQSALTVALFNHCSSTWNVLDPAAGARRRMLSFTPGTSPNRALYDAAQSVCINPELWIELLTRTSGAFELSLNPGSVSVSDPATGCFRPIWTAQPQRPKKTLAQLIDAQESADDLLALIGCQSPESPLEAGWFDRTISSFPPPPMMMTTSPMMSTTTAAAPSPARPDSRSSTHSRSSSFSSHSSASGASFSSVGSDDSASTASSSQSRRERNRVSKVYVDATKKEVTPYDGGKTTVLTGGVMLGAKPTTPKASATTFAQTMPWRRC